MIVVELRKLFRRPRTWGTIAALTALPLIVAILLAVTNLAPRPGRGPAFLSAVLTNGTLFPLAALAIVLPLFLPIAVAVVAGESIAGEAQAGTLRYLLADRPDGPGCWSPNSSPSWRSCWSAWSWSPGSATWPG